MNPKAIALRASRRRTLLIVGCGDIGLRVVRELVPRWRVIALTSSPQRMAALRAAGAVPLWGDLDRPRTLARIAGLADLVLHLAPPPSQGERDPRTMALLQALVRRGHTARLVYGSTTGVYGDCGGACIDETRPVAPATARAQRRVDAERRVRFFGRTHGATTTILRIPGIYGVDRDGGHPRDRVARGMPVLVPDEDVYTNHIEADDLARACIRALLLGRPQRVYNVCDDTDLRMGDYYDLVADLHGLGRPSRITREQAQDRFSAMQWSFMSESRRIRNARAKRELRLVLRYPTVREGLQRPA